MSLQLVFLCFNGAYANSITSCDIQAAFSQKCEPFLIERINTAKSEILVAVYSFSRYNIASALIKKYKEGVTVRIKIDAFQASSKYCRLTVSKLKKAGVEVQLIRMPEKVHMHNKFVIIDRNEVITGSYNFTSTASKKNWENVISINDSEVSNQYFIEWQKINHKKKTDKFIRERGSPE